VDDRKTYLVRLGLPDRPGALGSIASRFGALKGDVIGLEIVERRTGVAIDELVVSLPDDVPVGLVIKELSAEEGVEVEDIRPLDRLPYDPQLDALEVASIILGSESRAELADGLCLHVGRAVRASWACVVDRQGGVLASWGDRPADRWLESFVSSRPAIADAAETVQPPSVADAVWVPLPAAAAALVVGRNGASDRTAIRARERQRLAALARIADAWFHRLDEPSRSGARARHPSTPPV
jgi:hypothetical protein